MTKKYVLPKLLLAILALSGMMVFAATNKTVSRALNIARPDVKVQISGTVQREGKSVSVEKETVKPGDVLDWAVSSVNTGDGDAQNYSVVGQIPTGTNFVAGSAKGENSPVVQFSIDGGKVFSEKPMLEEKQADGTVKKVAAPVSMFTQVRFEWQKPLASQTKFDAAYRVSVK